jgi:NAD(P)-dependent dehydrogenase (short-subunit alcohol dehydrogenase family)
MDLVGRLALVTGGARGIGLGIVLRLAREGCNVVAADLRPPAVTLPLGSEYVECDVSSEDQVAAMMNQLESTYGALDILVTSAAEVGSCQTIVDMEPKVWRRVQSTNIEGVYLVSRLAVAQMLPRRRGAIVHIASVEALEGAARHAAYVATKSAVIGLTRSMALDFGRFGIRTNSVSPGIIDSGRADIEAGKLHDDTRRAWESRTVLARMGTVDEVAAATAFLVSDEASYVIGHNLVVDGGWTLGDNGEH